MPQDGSISNDGVRREAVSTYLRTSRVGRYLWLRGRWPSAEKDPASGHGADAYRAVEEDENGRATHERAMDGWGEAGRIGKPPATCMEVRGRGGGSALAARAVCMILAWMQI